MNSTLIIKLNATGDVVRTTALLRRLPGPITWITARVNMPLIQGLREDVLCLSWEDREQALGRRYAMVINLEDETEAASLAAKARPDRIFGARLDYRGKLSYSEDACEWFDMSLISQFGKEKADKLKFRNRRSYQEIIFDGLGLGFAAEQYLLPSPEPTDLQGDVAIAPVAGPAWPMKNWGRYDELRLSLKAAGFTVNMLPKRATLLEHLGDIANHRCLVSGDSLPMHLALGLGVPCVTLFTCTSPWEIYGYGLQTQIVSPLLGEFFYQRGTDPRAVSAIGTDTVFEAVNKVLAVAAR